MAEDTRTPAPREWNAPTYHRVSSPQFAWGQAVLDRLAAVTPPAPYPWVIRVLQAQEFNASNWGGGVIFVNSGVFRHLESEAQLAYVMGHEMGHQLKGHVSAGKSKRRLANILMAAGIGHS